MKKVGVYNNVSDKLLKTAQLKKGEMAVFKLVRMRQKPWAPGQWYIPTVNVPSTDVIYDPYDDEFKEIAFIKSIKPDGKFELQEIWVGPDSPRQPGAIVLSGDNAKDRELYEYLFLSNYWDRQDRDENKDLLLRLERPEEQAKEEREQRAKMIEAVVLAQKMKKSDLMAFMDAMGQDSAQSEDIMRDKAESMAVTDPEKFLKLANSNETKIKSVVRRAANMKQIRFDASVSAWKWTGNEEIILSVPRGKDRHDFFVQFLTQHENGPAVLRALEAL